MTSPAGITWSAYPLGIHFPTGQVRTRTKVYATPAGLYVYWAVPTNGDEPDWFSPIDYALTARPPAGYALKNGWDIYTEAGVVTLTAEGGCGCGWPLKRWVPTFARKRLGWPATV